MLPKDPQTDFRSDRPLNASLSLDLRSHNAIKLQTKFLRLQSDVQGVPHLRYDQSR